MQAPNEPRQREVRVFISSTFRDMHAERDHLVTVVFPELRERVEQLGLEFFDVDLRWGVPEKGADGEKANSWEYCRQWIDRVEPFFVCILGQRYGWVPAAKDFRSDEDKIRQESDPRSITDLEVRHAVLDDRKKHRSYFYLRETEAPTGATEYVDPPPLSGKLEQLKNEVRSCGRPVRDYPCEWTGSGFTAMEELGRLVLEDLWSGVLRDERYVGKEVWRQVLGLDPDASLLYTDESRPVPKEIWEKIVTLAKPAPQEPLDAERAQMETFATARMRWFQGRTEELEKLMAFIDATDKNVPRIAVVAAQPGQGKSALLAKFATLIAQPSTFVITHFVGATERSASAHSLVERLLGELDRSGTTWPAEHHEDGREPKQDFNSLCLRLAQWLGDYGGEPRIVILLDALNQLSDGHDLQWLPARLGPGVRVIVTCVEDVTAMPNSPDQRVLHALASRQQAPLRIPLGPLTEDDVRIIVIAYLKEYCHELDREHLDALCAIMQARNPLYLLVMLNELRTLGGNDLNRIVPARIAAMPQNYPDTLSLFRWVLQRLEVFGPEAVKWWCLYLAHGRAGMASQELADLLARKLGADAGATALRIERGLRRYLQRRGAQLDFFHIQLRQAVLDGYGGPVNTVVSHHEMAEYFSACAKGGDQQREWDTESVRGFSECVFHRVNAQEHDHAAQLLSTFPFLLHKTRVGLLEGVFNDYEILQREAAVDVWNRIEPWSGFCSEKAHILRRGNKEWPAHKILLQLAVEHAHDSPLTLAAEAWLGKNQCDWLWLQRSPRLQHLEKTACKAVLEGHGDWVNGALTLVGGRLLSWSDDRTLRLWSGHDSVCLAVLKGHSSAVKGALELADRRILSWSDVGPLRSYDATLRIWDANNGGCLALLEGHTREILGAQELASRRLVSWSKDCTLRIWDPFSCKCLATLEGHRQRVRGVLELPEERLLSWSDEPVLRVWDSNSGVCLVTLEGHTRWVNRALALADGRIVSWTQSLPVWSDDSTLRLWDTRSGKCLRMLVGHSEAVEGALVLSDGRLLSWSKDCTLRLWDCDSADCLLLLKGHVMGPPGRINGVKGALQLSDGCLLSWSWDGTMRCWDQHTGQCLAVFSGHGWGIDGALELDDGRLLSWSGNETIDLWDRQRGTLLGEFEGHTNGLRGVLPLPHSQLLSWSLDTTLRIWDANSSGGSASLEGHSKGVRGALTLPDGRVLSWSFDGTLRTWEPTTGKCLALLEGHTGCVNGALMQRSGELVSWSEDSTLRRWDSHSGRCVSVLRGHTYGVDGALLLADGRLLAWSDKARIWDDLNGESVVWPGLQGGRSDRAVVLPDGRLLSWSTDRMGWPLEVAPLFVIDGVSGKCLLTLKGHTDTVQGARVLWDGRLLSWSQDHTCRLWDGRTGACLTVFEGHTEGVRGALLLDNGQLLSWSWDMTVRLWDDQSGLCLAVVHEYELAAIHPDWLYARQKTQSPDCVVENTFLETSGRSAVIRTKLDSSIFAAWNAEADANACCLLRDGTAVITQANGQVCFLRLKFGNRRMSIDQLEKRRVPPES